MVECGVRVPSLVICRADLVVNKLQSPSQTTTTTTTILAALHHHNSSPRRYGISPQVATEQVKLAQLHALASSHLPAGHGGQGHVTKAREIAREAESVLVWFGSVYEVFLSRAREIGREDWSAVNDA
jgi:hypothetical protein